MNLLPSMVFGLVAGLVVRFIEKEREKTDLAGLRGATLPGIAGAVVGADLGGLLLGCDVKGFGLAGLGVAVAGALLLPCIGRRVTAAGRPV
jgi:uncharacterized membrane protein YeaQ/YmgE (transglycosylase-associated protein family)